MDNITDRAAALAEIGRVEASANVTRALTVFDAIDGQEPRITSSDRYDVAFAAWRTCMDVDAPIADEDIARLAFRAVHHIPEEQLIDLVDVQFGEHEKRIHLDADHALVWLPADECLILRFPSRTPGVVIDAVLGRTRSRA